MGKKLYRVEVTTVVYVLEDEDYPLRGVESDAAEYASSEEIHEYDVTEVTRENFTNDWEEHCLVYGNHIYGDSDISLEEALDTVSTELA